MNPLESRTGGIIVHNLDDNSLCRRDFLGCRTSAWHCCWSKRALWSWTARHVRSLGLQAVIFLRTSQTLKCFYFPQNVLNTDSLHFLPTFFTRLDFLQSRHSLHPLSISCGTF